MSKQTWKAGNMLYPLPAVMVSCGDKEGNKNIITIAWTGTICTNPAMVYISVRPERYSYHMIRETEEFVINLTTEELVRATDYCGVRSGKNVDKWKEMNLHQEKASTLSYAPLIAESPVNIECKVTEVKELGSHHMFLAEVTAVHVDEKYMNENNKFELNETGLLAYSHGEYLGLGKKLGTFGYSVKKTVTNAKSGQKNIDKTSSDAKKSTVKSSSGKKSTGKKSTGKKNTTKKNSAKNSSAKNKTSNKKSSKKH